MKKVLISLLFLVFAGVAVGQVVTPADPVQKEINITNEAKVSIRGIKVMQLAGDTFYGRINWENVFLRITIRTDKNTKFFRDRGGETGVSEIQVGNFLDVEGDLPLSADTLMVQAKTIRNRSILDEKRATKGSVLSTNIDASTFSMKSDNLGAITVEIQAASIKKGKRIISLSELKAGERVLSVAGTFNYGTKTLSASSVEMFQEKSVFTPRNFEGTVKTLNGTLPPTTIIATFEGNEYMVYLSEKTEVINRLRSKTELKRFTAGDKIRAYGTIRETNLSEIDAEIVRDMSF